MAMNLLDVVRDVRRHLEESGRVSLRMLQRQFALDIFSRVEVEFTGMSATLLAESLLAAGDFAPAEAAANDAITFNRRLLQGMYEVIARGVLARAQLRRDGPAARNSAEARFSTAEALIERTGARALTPALLEWRAELAAVLGDHTSCDKLLAQAVNGYDEIGAPGHAKRLRSIISA